MDLPASEINTIIKHHVWKHHNRIYRSLPSEISKRIVEVLTQAFLETPKNLSKEDICRNVDLLLNDVIEKIRKEHSSPST